MPTSINIANDRGRNATIGIRPVKATASPEFGVVGSKLRFRRYLTATESGTHEGLVKEFGENYAQALISGDPEIDTEVIGTFIEQTQVIYLDSDGQPMLMDPSFIDILFSPEGIEKDRKHPADSIANVNGDVPIRWTGKKISISEAVRRFSFKRAVQLQHLDGLTYDFLFAMAQDLESSNSMVLIGSGEKGNMPLIFQSNGRPYRGFLHGQTKGRAYRLSLHLSDLELKRPLSDEKRV